jgi:hypothetical protein
VDFLTQLLIGPLRVLGKTVETGLDDVARLGQGLLEQFVLAFILNASNRR